MPCIEKKHVELKNNEGCVKEGVRYLAINNKNNLNLVDMVSDPLLFDPTCRQIKGFILANPADPACNFVPLGFSKKDSFLESEKTKESCFYETVLQVVLNGKSCARTTAILDYWDICENVIVLWTNECDLGRVIGFDYDKELNEFICYEEPFGLVRHKDTLPAKGSGDKATDELEFSGQSDYPVLHLELSISDFKAAYV